MPIDPTGTSPQPIPNKPAENVVNMKCRKPECDSITANVMHVGPHGNQRLYRCTKCYHTWGLNVGGHIDI